MDGTIAQIVALTCFGNAFLQGQQIPAFFPPNSTCQFCDQVKFVSVKKSLFGKRREQEIVKTPDEWFSYLKSKGTKRIYLSISPQNNPNIPDRMSAGFVGGGGTWSIESILPKNQSNYWISRWEVGNKNDPNKRIWRVTYGKVWSNSTSRKELIILNDIIVKLTESLTKIHHFSEKQDCGGFTNMFAEALDTLVSKGKNLHGYHKDLAPEGFLSLEALTILDACQTAWVFGGMGSWNDMSFKGDTQKEYDTLSEQLFQTVNEAIAAGANSTFKLE
jgi:hypothetical protein